ncbi:MAG: sulfonate transport system substrate-binding protein [Gaiellaceae bacterium]|jgi:sulfonate transport system substrate-binding protein|nr:sulfonate transport system substrate-binding protein [Gaiellaceae bacterium]MDX6469499.1 sulfonate transport system substrate-binding protein [Gaiellaceae bacterium]
MSFHGNRGRLVGLAAGLAATVAVAAASATAHAATGGLDLSKVTLKVGVYPAQGDDALLKAAGLDKTPYKVSYATFASGALQTQAVNQGTTDLGRGSGVSNVLIAAAGKPNFLAVGTLKLTTYQQGTLVGKGSSISTIGQLKGKKVALVRTTTSEYFLLKQLQSAGLTFKDVTIVPVDPGTGLSALLSGSVDAYAGFGNINQGVAQGARVLADGAPYLRGRLGALEGSYNAYAADLKDPAKSAAIADFIARVNTALAWARTHANEWAKVVATNSQQPVETVLANFQAGEKQVKTWVGPTQPEAISNEQDYANAFLTAGTLSSGVNAAGYYSTKLNPLIARDEAALEKKHPSWFLTPAWLRK